MRKGCALIFCLVAVCMAICFAFSMILCYYPRPYRTTVQESGLPKDLVYAVMKAESGFREDAVSRAGAVGIMQITPSTAEFICLRNGIPFAPERLSEGEYNVMLGCLYLSYLLVRFKNEEAALCAYNAGEGTVRRWLNDPAYSADGVSLFSIPYAETRDYVKKISEFRKIYRIFCR